MTTEERRRKQRENNVLRRLEQLAEKGEYGQDQPALAAGLLMLLRMLKPEDEVAP
jgi:hypothetical protein